MNRRTFVLAGLVTSHFLLLAYSGAQPAESRLKSGDALPQLAGEALTGKWLDLSSASRGNPAVIVLSFSRSGGRDAQQWTQRLTQDHPHLAIYTVIFLESVPELFRGMAVTGIKDGMPAALKDRTILLYRDEDRWKQRLTVVSDRNACILLLRTTGQIQWLTTGPFAVPLYSELSKSILAAN